MSLPIRYRCRPLFAALVLGLVAAPGHAERADRKQPVQLDADRIIIDDKKQVTTYEGDVRFVQGTLQIRADRVLVTQENGGFERGIAFGKVGAQAWFKQKREGRDEYVEGQADRIEYDSQRERAEFFGNATVKNGQDMVSGPYILYDAKAERYEVGANPAQAAAPQPAGRVRAVIQPRADTAPPAKPANP